MITFPVANNVFHVGLFNYIFIHYTKHNNSSYSTIDSMVNDLLESLNEEQKIAVTHENGPLLILAGAGSGKTRVLTYRAAWLIAEKHIDPSEIALLTFTNKAASEMKERVKNISGGKMPLGFAGTFHTFCARILRNYGYNIGLSPNFVIYDSDDSESLMKNVIKDMKLDPKESKPRVFLAIISKMKNDLVSVDEADAVAKDYFYKQLNIIWREYQKRLEKNNAVDFDDLLVKAVSILKIDRVREAINSQLKWILVDEYQDTNKAQFELTRLLTGEAKNITAVGDAAQAIYSFRGADFRNLLLLQNEYPELTTVSLPRNYRSTQKILDAAYGVIKHNESHPVIKLASTGDEGEKIELYEALDEKDEARFVVNHCQKLAEKGEEAVVLYRTNAQSRSFEDELMKRNLSYRLIGGRRFYNRAEIKDLIAFLRLIVNREEEISLQRVEKIGKRKAQIFFYWLAVHQANAEKQNPGKTLEEIINVTKYDEKFDERDEDDLARIENINELLAVASEFPDLGNFLENAALSESEDKRKSANAKITLMTIHAAKGLEFDNVFIVGLEEGLFPHSRTLMSRDEIEEERRLMYVAMTRAKKNLTVSFARSRLVYGGRTSPFPSRFISEIPEGLLKHIGKELEIKKKVRGELLDEFGEKQRIIVQDWEIEEASKDDFAEVDNW